MINASSLKELFQQKSEAKKSTAHKRKRRPSPLSIRLSEEERATLEHAASGQSLNSYVRGRLFNDKSSIRKRGNAPVKDYEALARALSLLGRSDIQTRLAALLLALEQQNLVASEQTKRDIQQACTDVKEVRAALVSALGLKAK